MAGNQKAREIAEHNYRVGIQDIFI